LSLSLASPAAFPLDHPLLSATGPGGDDDAAAESGGARLPGWLQCVVVAAKEKSALRMLGTTVIRKALN